MVVDAWVAAMEETAFYPLQMLILLRGIRMPLSVVASALSIVVNSFGCDTAETNGRIRTDRQINIVDCRWPKRE